MTRPRIIKFNRPWAGKVQPPMSQQDRDDLAKRLRLENARLEQGPLAVKTPARGDRYDDELDEEEFISEADVDAGTFQYPSIDEQLTRNGSSLTGFSIMEEIQEDKLSGKLRPFVEGEPIGTIRHWPRQPAPMFKTPKELYEERQKCLTELRAKNDAAITTILNRR